MATRSHYYLDRRPPIADGMSEFETNMIVGDAALIAIGIHAGTEWAAKAIPARNP
jgi:hypothetical protein